MREQVGLGNERIDNSDNSNNSDNSDNSDSDSSNKIINKTWCEFYKKGSILFKALLKSLIYLRSLVQLYNTLLFCQKTKKKLTTRFSKTLICMFRSEN